MSALRSIGLYSTNNEVDLSDEQVFHCDEAGLSLQPQHKFLEYIISLDVFLQIQQDLL